MKTLFNLVNCELIFTTICINHNRVLIWRYFWNTINNLTIVMNNYMYIIPLNIVESGQLSYGYHKLLHLLLHFIWFQGTTMLKGDTSNVIHTGHNEKWARARYCIWGSCYLIVNLLRYYDCFNNFLYRAMTRNQVMKETR